MNKLTQEKLKELLHYDPDTGAFTWKVNGNVAGCSSKGRRWAVLNGKAYLNSRLAHLYIKGVLPGKNIRIYHINNNISDDRWSNLVFVELGTISQKLLKLLIHYDPTTGKFTRKIDMVNQKAGTTVGIGSKNRYMRPQKTRGLRNEWGALECFSKR